MEFDAGCEMWNDRDARCGVRDAGSARYGMIEMRDVGFEMRDDRDAGCAGCAGCGKRDARSGEGMR